MTEDGISEIEDRKVECTQSEKKRRDWKQKDRTSGTCGRIIKNSTSVSLESQKEKSEKKMDSKNT